jgi:hypothetical protein
MGKKKTKGKSGGSAQPAGEEDSALDRTESAPVPEEEEEGQEATDQQPLASEEVPTQTAEDSQQQGSLAECPGDDVEALRSEVAQLREQVLW